MENNENNENNKNNENNENTCMAFHFQTFWENIDTSNFNKILTNIFNRDIDIIYKEKLALWIHKQSVKDKNIYRTIDNRLINEIYKYISDDIIISVIENLDNLKLQTIECSICRETLDKPYAGECGHVFCKTCIDKHIRISGLRNTDVKCPKCRENINQARRIYI